MIKRLLYLAFLIPCIVGAQESPVGVGCIKSSTWCKCFDASGKPFPVPENICLARFPASSAPVDLTRYDIPTFGTPPQGEPEVYPMFKSRRGWVEGLGTFPLIHYYD